MLYAPVVQINETIHRVRRAIITSSKILMECFYFIHRTCIYIYLKNARELLRGILFILFRDNIRVQRHPRNLLSNFPVQDAWLLIHKDTHAHTGRHTTIRGAGSLARQIEPWVFLSPVAKEPVWFF